MSSLVRITKSFTALLEHTILGGFSSDKAGISYNINLLTAPTKIFQTEIRPTKPHFQNLGRSAFPPFLNTVYSFRRLALWSFAASSMLEPQSSTAFWCGRNSKKHPQVSLPAPGGMERGQLTGFFM